MCHRKLYMTLYVIIFYKEYSSTILSIGAWTEVFLILQGEKRKEPFMLYTDCPSGSLLRKKIDEFNSSTTGLIMTMVS